MEREGLTYKKAGVDIDEGEKFVSIISPIVRKTFRKEVMTEIGSFGALFRLDIKKYKDPILVSGTDGVGTKLKIAFMMDKHDTIGIDLVAMCVNDILTLGAEPLFFLDYFATGKLYADKHSDVVKGIAQGCLEAGCSLIGGETAEMPGFYKEGEYDLAGFAVGVVERDNVIDGLIISEGDKLIGITSNGLHSNGYSLARKIFFDMEKLEVDDYLSEINNTLGEELLKPTRIYVNAFNLLNKKINIKGMAHITGGGITGNLPRILRDGLTALVYKDSWKVPPIFYVIQKLGKVPEEEMRRTFNMGIGYIMVVDKNDADEALKILKNGGFDSYEIGVIVKGRGTKISYV